MKPIPKNIPIVDPSFSDNLNDFINTIEMIENAIDAIIENMKNNQKFIIFIDNRYLLIYFYKYF